MTDRDDYLDDEFDDEEDELQDYVVAVFARTDDQAETYRDLLEDHDIPVLIGDETLDEEDVLTGPRAARHQSRSVPILVPESFLDEASEIIADHEDTSGYAGDDEGWVEDDEDESDDEDVFSADLDEEDLASEEDEPDEDLFGEEEEGEEE